VSPGSCPRALSDSIPRGDRGHRSARLVATGLAVQLHASQRRGLFDFVSPFVVFLAALSYLLFAAFVIYIQQHPFPGFAGLINLGAPTLVYALNAFVVYLSLDFSLRLLDLKRWEPFSLSIFFVICALVASMGFAAPLRKPEGEEIGSDGRLT
jgi:hypothetical protein